MCDLVGNAARSGAITCVVSRRRPSSSAMSTFSAHPSLSLHPIVHHAPVSILTGLTWLTQVPSCAALLSQQQ